MELSKEIREGWGKIEGPQPEDYAPSQELLNKRAAERMARQSDACWDHRTVQADCPNCLHG